MVKTMSFTDEVHQKYICVMNNDNNNSNSIQFI